MSNRVFTVDELNRLLVNFFGRRGSARRWLDSASATVSVSDPNIITAAIDGDSVIVTPVAPGTATVTVTADAAPGDRVAYVSGQFDVTVVEAEAEALEFSDAIQIAPEVVTPVEPEPAPAEPVVEPAPVEPAPSA
jgi:hypothetical protein